MLHGRSLAASYPPQTSTIPYHTIHVQGVRRALSARAFDWCWHALTCLLHVSSQPGDAISGTWDTCAEDVAGMDFGSATSYRVRAPTHYYNTFVLFLVGFNGLVTVFR